MEKTLPLYLFIGVVIGISFTLSMPPNVVIKPTNATDTVYVTNNKIHEYLYALRMAESRDVYEARRPGSQYVGAYQVGNLARESIGYGYLNNKIGYQVMLNTPELQDAIMLRLVQYQAQVLDTFIKQYDRTMVGKYWVTASGIIAMAHLVGQNPTIAFLKSRGDSISYDGHGTPITQYLQFNNINLTFNEN